MTNEKKKALLDEGKAITAKAKFQNRSLTVDEQSRLNTILERVETENRMDQLTGKAFRSEDGPTGGWEQLAVKLTRGKALTAEVPLGTVLRGKNVESFPTADEYRTEAPFVRFATDENYLFGVFPSRDAGNSLSIHDFRQSGSRSVTGSVQRDPTATTPKAELDVSIESVDEDLVQLAVVISDVPNAIFEADTTLMSFLASEMRLQLNEKLDQHVIQQIYAAGPPAGSTGDDQVAKIRNGLAAARALGANPTTLALSHIDAATLDLTTDDGGYVFPLGATNSTSPWSLRVVEAKSAPDPLIIDPVMAGTLYRGALKIDLDPYTGFKNNTTNVRAEFTALMHIRNADGVYEVGSAGFLT